MTDWPVLAGNFFVAASLAALMSAPIVGVACVNHPRRSLPVWIGIPFAFSLLTLTMGWRDIPGGMLAAIAGHAALAVSVLALTQIGRVLKLGLRDQLLAGLTGLLAGTAITLGPFALGPMAADLSLDTSRWLLAADPLVTVSSAAGIDLLHLDLIYRISPLAHRGVALPAWTAACAAYAVFGLACFGVSRLRRRSA